MLSILEWSKWSSNPDEMEISTHFSHDSGKPTFQTHFVGYYFVNAGVDVPGLSQAFNIPNLRPLMVKPDPDLGDEYLVTDDNDKFYLFNSMTMQLWQFTIDMQLQDIVEIVRKNRYETASLARVIAAGATGDPRS